MDAFHDLFSIEPVSDPSAAVRNGEVEIPSPFAPNAGSEKSQSVYKDTAESFFRNIVNTSRDIGNLLQSGIKIFRLVSKESPNGLLAKIRPTLTSAKAAFVGPTGATASNVGVALPELSMAAPMLVAGGMLFLVMRTLQGINGSIETLSEELFMHKVRDLDGARETAKRALLAVTNAGYKGFEDSAYTQLKKEFASFCGVLNDKIGSTDPEGESCFASIFRSADKWEKQCCAMKCGVKSLVDTVIVSSDLCCQINPIVAYNDRVEDLKVLTQIDFGRLAEILHYVDHEKFADFESYVTNLPDKLSTLVKAQDQKPVLIVSREELEQQQEKAHG